MSHTEKLPEAKPLGLARTGSLPAPLLTVEEELAFKALLIKFVNSYAAHREAALESWLVPQMQEQLPDRSAADIEAAAKEIIDSIEIAQEKNASLRQAVAKGRSKEAWFASELKQKTSGLTAQEAAEYLTNLDTAVKRVNLSLTGALNAVAGTEGMSQPGDTAEEPQRDEIQAQDWNEYTLKDLAMNIGRQTCDAALQGAVYSAGCCLTQKLREEMPEGEVKDIAVAALEETVKNGPEAGVKLATAEALKAGAEKTLTSCLPAKVPLGEINNIAAAVIDETIYHGPEAGLKAAAAGALKVGVEKGVVRYFPKGSPAAPLANIACIAVDNIGTMAKVASGECSVEEAVEEMVENSVATSAAVVAGEAGASVGAAIGSVLGPMGAAVGGFIGGAVASIAGSKVGRAVVKGAKRIVSGIGEFVSGCVSTAREVASGVCSVARSVCSSIGSAVSSFCSSVGSCIGSLFGW